MCRDKRTDDVGIRYRISDDWIHTWNSMVY